MKRKSESRNSVELVPTCVFSFLVTSSSARGELTAASVFFSFSHICVNRDELPVASSACARTDHGISTAFWGFLLHTRKLAFVIISEHGYCAGGYGGGGYGGKCRDLWDLHASRRVFVSSSSLPSIKSIIKSTVHVHVHATLGRGGVCRKHHTCMHNQR